MISLFLLVIILMIVSTVLIGASVDTTDFPPMPPMRKEKRKYYTNYQKDLRAFRGRKPRK